MPPKILIAVLLVLGSILTLTVVPGAFTIDEPYYLVTAAGLQEGRLTVPGTEDFPPARGLVWFDPLAKSRRIDATPVASTAPPLYAPLALPFSVLGWRGLVALNVVAFLATIAMVFAFTARHAASPATPWLAAAALALGGSTVEYAQGLWPQGLAMALTTGAVLLAARTRAASSIRAGLAAALLAGLLAGLASGVRYQNVVFAAGVGAGLLLLAPRGRRLRAAAAFALGLALPLAVASAVNHARLGSWNPVSKGPRYLSTGAPSEAGRLADAARMAWARVVDYTAKPLDPKSDEALYTHVDPDTGAHFIGPTVKKAWLQSAPWIGLALALLALAAWPGGAARREEQADRDRRRELLALGLVVVPVLAMFAAAGVRRTDGLTFNQRYFLELVPLAAVAFAWALDRAALRRTAVLAGAAAAGLAVLALLRLASPGEPLRQLALLYLPLALALALVGAWAAARRAPGRAGALSVIVGLCLGWALTVHLGEDLRASRAMRRANALRLAQLERALPERSFTLVTAPFKDAAGPLIAAGRVLADPRLDDPETVRGLVDRAHALDRRVYLVADGVPRPLLAELLGVYPAREASGSPLTVLELGPRR